MSYVIARRHKVGGSLSSVHLYAEHNMGIVKTDLFIVKKKKKVKIICIIAILALWVSKRTPQILQKWNRFLFCIFREYVTSEKWDHVQNCWCRSSDMIMRSPQKKFPSFINVLPGDALTTLRSIDCKPCRNILLKNIHVTEAPTKIFGITKCGKMKEELINPVTTKSKI